MTFPAPPLEGFVVIVQHRPDVSIRLEVGLAHAGAVVFTAKTAAETIEAFQRYQAHLIEMDSHDAENAVNNDVAFEGFHRLDSSSICYSEIQPDAGFIQLSRWVDINLPVSVVVDEAIAYRRRMKI